MKERREYFRSQAFARVALRALAPEEVDTIRARLRSRRRTPIAVDDTRHSAESRALLELMQHMALTLDRIDQKLDSLILGPDAVESSSKVEFESVEINLSASGFSGKFSLDAPVGTLVEAQVDLWESGAPLITAIARVETIEADPEGGHTTALSFEELLPEDLERLVQLTLRNQTKQMHVRREGGRE